MTVRKKVNGKGKKNRKEEHTVKYVPKADSGETKKIIRELIETHSEVWEKIKGKNEITANIKHLTAMTCSESGRIAAIKIFEGFIGLAENDFKVLESCSTLWFEKRSLYEHFLSRVIAEFIQRYKNGETALAEPMQMILLNFSEADKMMFLSFAKEIFAECDKHSEEFGDKIEMIEILTRKIWEKDSRYFNMVFNRATPFLDRIHC
ncbi:hypothetical protein JXB01_01605 [Candidatus Micrarchaeota archaeon]|nr:hypothetical protein [Candidatus Micrarchaeota archaeon]